MGRSLPLHGIRCPAEAWWPWKTSSSSVTGEYKPEEEAKRDRAEPSGCRGWKPGLRPDAKRFHSTF